MWNNSIYVSGEAKPGSRRARIHDLIPNYSLRDRLILHIALNVGRKRCGAAWRGGGTDTTPGVSALLNQRACAGVWVWPGGAGSNPARVASTIYLLVGWKSSLLAGLVLCTSPIGAFCTELVGRRTASKSLKMNSRHCGMLASWANFSFDALSPV